MQHILDAISRIEEYTLGLKYKGFLKNHLVQDGVIRQIEIIGEAAKRLSPKMRDQISDIPWKDIAGDEIVLPMLREKKQKRSNRIKN